MFFFDYNSTTICKMFKSQKRPEFINITIQNCLTQQEIGMQSVHMFVLALLKHTQNPVFSEIQQNYIFSHFVTFFCNNRWQQTQQERKGFHSGSLFTLKQSWDEFELTEKCGNLFENKHFHPTLCQPFSLGSGSCWQIAD